MKPYAARLSVFPLLFGGAGCMVAGLIAVRVARVAGNVARGRRTIASVGCLGAAALLFLHTTIRDPLWSMVVMGLASLSNDLVLPSAWGACMDIGGKYAGTLSGSMNMMGNLAGGAAPVVVGYILNATNNNWLVPIYVMAAIYLIGVVCWLLLDPVTPLEPAEAP